MPSWADIGFEIEITGDGSPSLRLLQSVIPEKDRGESMHHSGGAWAETQLIYASVIADVLKKVERPHFVVVGLGLGYIEMSIAREALLQQKEVGLITSFESVPELRNFFWSWVHEQNEKIPSEIKTTYDDVAACVVGGTSLIVSDIKKFLAAQFSTLDSLHSELSSDFTIHSRYHCILYDAFSSKTTPHLWSEDFLLSFLSSASAESATFSTYACRGTLKRALQQSGFQVIVREGFQGKRNSTLALR